MKLDELLNHPIEFIYGDDQRFRLDVLKRFVSKLKIGDKPVNIDTNCIKLSFMETR